MKRFFSVVFVLAIALALAACTAADVDVTDNSTTSTTSVHTTSSPSQKETTTSLITETTSAQSSESTTISTDNTTTDSSTTTTTTAINITTTTTNKTTVSGNVAMYAEHPRVPDYGALVGVNCNKYKNGVYYYAVAQLQAVDPQNQSASQYMQLLNDHGYIALAPYDKDGVQGYLYGNPNNGIMVLFGAARDQGAVVVAISQQ